MTASQKRMVMQFILERYRIVRARGDRMTIGDVYRAVKAIPEREPLWARIVARINNFMERHA